MVTVATKGVLPWLWLLWRVCYHGYSYYGGCVTMVMVAMEGVLPWLLFL